MWAHAYLALSVSLPDYTFCRPIFWLTFTIRWYTRTWIMRRLSGLLRKMCILTGFRSFNVELSRGVLNSMTASVLNYCLLQWRKRSCHWKHWERSKYVQPSILCYTMIYALIYDLNMKPVEDHRGEAHNWHGCARIFVMLMVQFIIVDHWNLANWTQVSRAARRWLHLKGRWGSIYCNMMSFQLTCTELLLLHISLHILFIVAIDYAGVNLTKSRESLLCFHRYRSYFSFYSFIWFDFIWFSFFFYLYLHFYFCLIFDNSFIDSIFCCIHMYCVALELEPVGKFWT